MYENNNTERKGVICWVEGGRERRRKILHGLLHTSNPELNLPGCGAVGPDDDG